MSQIAGPERWAIVLAGGGSPSCARYCRSRYDDGRPEQFCAIGSKRSLVEQTLERTRYFADPRRTVVSVCRKHLPWRHLWESAAGPLTSVQPRDAGTGPAALLATMLVELQSPQATVALFPSDQYASNKRRLMEPVYEAATWVERHPNDIVALGVSPSYPETEYGWLLPRDDVPFGGYPQAARLIEKPTLSKARRLLARGAYWSTFVLVYHTWTLLRLMELFAPDWWLPLFNVRVLSDAALDVIFASLRPFSLSRHILERCPGHIRLLPVHGLTWSDLGSERRIHALERHVLP